MRGEIEAIRASKRKAEAHRDNWKARYDALEAALRGAALADAIALPRRNYQDMHDARVDAIGDYRARLLALIDAAKEAT